MTLVAMSAAYGAAGSRVGPELAERLGVPFIDRAIPIGVAQRLHVPVDEAIAQEDRGSGGRGFLERLLAGFTAADNALPAAPTPELVTPEDFHAASVAVIQEQARTGQGVILGRGAVAALREQPGVLRVRLTGPAERRLRLAMQLGAVDEDTARSTQRRLDAAHAEYLRRFYGIDIDDPSLYHLVIDATAFALETILEIIEEAVHPISAGA